MEWQNGHNEPEGSSREPAPGVFDRVNNYVLLIYALACFFMYYSTTTLFILYRMPVLSLIFPGILAFVLPLFLLSRRFSLSFTREYRLKGPDLHLAILTLLITGSLIFPSDAMLRVIERRWPPGTEYINFMASIKPKGLLSFLTIALGAVVLSPLAEELIFRGFIQRIFQRNMNGTLSVLLASTIFGLCHFNLPRLPVIMLLGVILGYLFYRTGNLLYPTIAHALYNLVSLVVLQYTPAEELGAVSDEPPHYTWVVLSIAALALSIYLIERRSGASTTKE